MKNRTFGLLLGSFLILAPASQALCMGRLGTLGALAAATVATQCKKAETFWGSNKNSSNNNTSSTTEMNFWRRGVTVKHGDGTVVYHHRSKNNKTTTINILHGNAKVTNIYNPVVMEIDDKGKMISISESNSRMNEKTTYSAHHVIGSGNRTTKTTLITGSPSKVDVSFGNLTIKQGNEQSLIVHADDNLHQHLKQVVSAASIQLGVKENSSFSTKNPIEYTLTLRDMPNDLRVRVSGSSSITTSGNEDCADETYTEWRIKDIFPTLQTK